jgi:hypothetical protein
MEAERQLRLAADPDDARNALISLIDRAIG